MEGPLFYLIKEASELTGVNAHTIRFWEKSFPGFLMPKRSGDKNKQRLYSSDDIEMIKRIRQVVQSEKNSIERAREILGGTEINLRAEEGAARDDGGETKAVVHHAQTPARIIKNILNEIKELKEGYKNEFETVYEGLNLIIEQTSTKGDGEELKLVKEQMLHLEALVRQNLKSSVSAEAEKQELLQAIEDLRFQQLKDSEEKFKTLTALKQTVEEKNSFQRIIWIVSAGAVCIAAAWVIVASMLR